jgi:hypothetical protein
MPCYAVNPLAIEKNIITTDDTDGHELNSGRGVFLPFVFFVLFVVFLRFLTWLTV